jgi:hypothetical protein
MNWTKGLFRIWVVGALLWVILIGFSMGLPAWQSLGCPTAGPWCQYQQPPSEAFRATIITALGYPLGVLAIGSGLLWAAKGFQKAT